RGSVRRADARVVRRLRRPHHADPLAAARAGRDLARQGLDQDDARRRQLALHRAVERRAPPRRLRPVPGPGAPARRAGGLRADAPLPRRTTRGSRWNRRFRIAGTRTRRSCGASRSGSSAARGSTPATSGSSRSPASSQPAPAAVTRDRDGVLRAFLNVCRHRGSVVAEGEGTRETLQCPYHAWTYGLDGRLRAAPRSEEEPDFPQSELGLVPAAVDTWGPFVFVNLDPGAEPLAGALGSLPAQVAELGLDVDSLVHHSRWEAELDANWKIVCENFLECYHCQVAHPAFSEVVDVSPE